MLLMYVTFSYFCEVLLRGVYDEVGAHFLSQFQAVLVDITGYDPEKCSITCVN